MQGTHSTLASVFLKKKNRTPSRKPLVAIDSHTKMKIMKHILKYLLMIIVFGLVLSSCKKINQKTDLRIDLVSQFEDDYVILKLDDETIFSDYVTTNHLLGFGEIIVLNRAKGKYKLSISINGNKVEEKFKHTEGMYLVIRYNDPSTISLDFPEEYFVYD
jgi:hypothetical protein